MTRIFEQQERMLGAVVIIMEVNRLRRNMGLNVLRLDPLLTRSAQTKADDMYLRNYDTEIDPDGIAGRTLVHRVTGLDMDCGELVGRGYKDGYEAIDAWDCDFGNAYNMIDARWTRVGVGMRNLIWVVHFAAERQEQHVDDVDCDLCIQPHAISQFDGEYAKELLQYVNVSRWRHSVEPLQLDPALMKSAQSKANDMRERDYFSEIDPDGFDMGYTENLCQTTSSPYSVFNQWRRSIGHHQTIIDRKYSRMGVGIKLRKDGQLYNWVQHLA